MRNQITKFFDFSVVGTCFDFCQQLRVKQFLHWLHGLSQHAGHAFAYGLVQSLCVWINCCIRVNDTVGSFLVEQHHFVKRVFARLVITVVSDAVKSFFCCVITDACNLLVAELEALAILEHLAEVKLSQQLLDSLV